MEHTKALKISILISAMLLVGVVSLFVSTSKASFGERAKSFDELGGDFKLVSQGGDIALSDFEGKAVVLYFGYLSCPEVCPNSMLTISRALKKLTAEQSSDVKVMLVSIDPARDSVEKLDEFARFFHPNIVGLTGSEDAIEGVLNQYGVYRSIDRIEGDGSEYFLDHTSRYYVINKSGELVDAMRHSTTSNELAARLRTLI